MNIEAFLNKLTTTKTSEKLFNPFSEICSIHDKEDAPEIRKRNLKLLLETHLKQGTKTIWLFEAPSYMGMRRSGAPFVNEGMFEEIEEILQTQGKFEKATKTESKTAMTSKMVWNVAKELNIKPLIWESLLFHPHKIDDQMTNRKPTNQELLQYKDFLMDIFEMIKPTRVIAVGRVAEASAQILGVDAKYVRHPAQGGYREFRAGLKNYI